MITICPQCQLSLAVSAADLRVAQGHVRCGRCASVFNALVSLYDSEAEALSPEAALPEAVTEEAAAMEATQSRMMAVTIERAATDAGANTGRFSADTVGEYAAWTPPADAATVEGAPAATASPAETGLVWLPAANDPGIEELVAANDPIADAESFGIQASLPQNIERLDIDLGDLSGAGHDWQVVPQLQPTRAEPDPSREPSAQMPQPEPAQRDGSAVSPAAPANEAAAIEEPAGAPETRRRARFWGAGSAVLALLLAGQWVHDQRETLVGWPALTQPLTRFYAALGRPIRLRGDLRAYDVRQLGAVAAADTPGTLTVRASLRNLLPRPQPMPLLRVTLQDRYGNRIASRDLTAAEYQQRPAGTAPMTLLAAGARLETSVQLVDPGGKAVGFELDVCLAENGVTRCASDLAAATSR